ncbi:MAG: hypothetical protein P8H45_02620 [Flavobacteriaceae bacterium]|nr:hypothetical protein [Flavobacteriaceae bacterium]
MLVQALIAPASMIVFSKNVKHQPNESWNIVLDEEEKGIYKYIDENGEFDISPIH